MFMEKYLMDFMNSGLIKIAIACIVMDVVLGVLRALKDKRFNSSAGIDGLIRKAGMILALAFALFVDKAANINIIALMPDGIKAIFPMTTVGLCEFFSIMFILFEAVSILKNMTLCGIPIPAKLKKYIENFLDDMTAEKAKVNTK